MGHHQRNVIVNSNSVLMDQSQPPPPLLEQNICFCSKFLNPFSSSFGNSHCLVTPNNLQHYCRVCNIQLNSCRQAKIHSEGKKHDKRLSYLRFCLESSDTSAAVAYLQNGTAPVPLMDTPPPNSAFSAPMQNATGSTQSVPSVGQLPPAQQLPVVQSTTQQQPPSIEVPPPNIVQQPCNVPPPQGAIYTGYSTAPPPPPGPGTQLPPPPNVMPQNCSNAIPQPCSSSSMTTASIYPQPVMPSIVTSTTPYFYPQATTTSMAGTQVAPGALGYHSLPPPLHHQTTYYDYTYMAPMISADGSMSGQSSNSLVTSVPMHHSQPPPPLANPINVYPTSNISNNPTTSSTYTTNSNGQVIFHCNVMSPSLTSGFSGSGGDCKSTETSSILSTASFSSNAMHYNGTHQHKKKGASNSNTGNMSSTMMDKMNNNNISGGNSGNNKDGIVNEKGFAAICEICRLPFPSQAVLENHLRGSRHARRVKSQQAFKQLHDTGALFRHEEGVSEIRCEVCRVSVNSSHQLQAHLLGHKHRVRAVRRGVKPNQAIIIPSSSTDVTTTSPSGASSESGNESPPSQSASGQQPKLQKQKQSKQSQQIQQVNGQGVTSSGSLQRRRRSSAFIVPQNLSGPTSSSSITTTLGSTINNTTQLSRRHRSSGCLSKHCSHSTLSLSNTAFSQHRARSSSALNKVHSRSMNLLMLHTGGLTQSIRQDDSSSTDEGFDRDDRRKVKQRPRSYSTRTAKEGEAGTANRNEKSSTQTQQHQLEGKSILQKRSKSSKNYTVEHHVKGILNSLVVKSHQKDKQQSRHQKSMNKQQLVVAQNDQKTNNSLNNHTINRRTPNHNGTSIKPSKTASPTTQSLGNTQSNKKQNTSPNSKKLKNIPMLGVFLEGLNNNGHHFPSNNKKNNQNINNNNNNNNYNHNSNTAISKMIKSCENKKKQKGLEKPQLANGIANNGVAENNLANKVAA